MDQIPGKRNREEVFSSPDFVDNKRPCQVNSDMSDSDSSMMDSPASHTTSMETIEFRDTLLKTFQSKEVLSVLCATVTEIIRPMIREEIERLTTKNNMLEGAVISLNKKLVEKDKVILELTQRQDRSEQYARRNNLRLSGISEKEGENTDNMVIAVAKSVGVDITPQDIDISHRVPKRPNTVETPSRPILVKFVSNAKQRLLLHSRSKLKLVPREKKAPKIYINEDLTRPRAVLAGRARKLVSENKFESSWVTGGVILIKLKNGDVKKVANSEQFEELCEATIPKPSFDLSLELQPADPDAEQ